MTNNQIVAGVDSSTQSCKIILKNGETGQTIAFGQAKHPDGTECHPDNWLKAFIEAKDNLQVSSQFAEEISAGELFNSIKALGVAGQQHGLVLLDKDCEIIRPALLWNDTKSAQAAEELNATFGQDYWQDKTGSALVASITITKLLYLAKSEPENIRKVAAICLPHDWLQWRIAGFGPKSQGATPDLTTLWTDRSDASGTGYFNPSTNSYDYDLLDIALKPAGIDSSNIILPDVKSYDYAYKVSQSTSLLSQNTTISAGAGDNAAAALGLGLNNGDICVSLGTSGVVSGVSDKWIKGEGINGFADASGNFLPLICTLNASRDIDIAKTILSVSYDELSDLALRADKGAGGITLLPYFQGERTPNRPNANGSLFGLTIENSTPENIARGFVEGMLLGVFDGAAALKEKGLDIKRIFLIGGGAKLKAVSEIAPQIFGKPVLLIQADDSEDNVNMGDGEFVAIGATKQAFLPLNSKPADWQGVKTLEFSGEHNKDLVKRYQKIKQLKTLGEL